MDTEFAIYNTPENLSLLLNQGGPLMWYTGITCLVDTDKTGHLCGVEISLYEESKVDYSLIKKQFASAKKIMANEDGLIYITFRSNPEKRGFGFGRVSEVGISTNGYLSVVRFPWKELGAKIPFVNPEIALEGLDYTNNPPPFELNT